MSRKRYLEFVETGLATGDEEFEEALKASPSGIGDEVFLKWVEHLRGKRLDKRRQREDVAFRRVQEPFSPEVVLAIVAKVLGVAKEAFEERERNSPLRAVAGRYLVRYAGQTQREVAKRLGMTTGGAVSAQLARLPALVLKDRQLARRVREIERLLDARRNKEAGRA